MIHGAVDITSLRPEIIAATTSSTNKTTTSTTSAKATSTWWYYTPRDKVKSSRIFVARRGPGPF